MINNLPDKFKFKSKIKGMGEIVYAAFKVEDSYVIIWDFLGEQQNIIMSVKDMIYRFNQGDYEFAY